MSTIALIDSTSLAGRVANGSSRLVRGCGLAGFVAAAILFCVPGGSSVWAQQPYWGLDSVEAPLNQSAEERAPVALGFTDGDVHAESGAFSFGRDADADQHRFVDSGVAPAKFAQEAAGEPIPQPLPPSTPLDSTNPNWSVTSELDALNQRVKELETSQRAHEDATRAIIRKSLAERGSNITDSVIFGGTLESLTFWEEDFDGVAKSNTILDTAELDFEIRVNDWSTGYLTWEYDPGQNFTFPTTEEDPGGVFVDRINVRRGIVTLGNVEKYPLFATFGRDTVPFGIATGDPVADTLTINDPLTIEVFETKQDFVMIGFEWPTPPPPPPLSANPAPPPPQVRPLLFNPLVRNTTQRLCSYCGYPTPAKTPPPYLPPACVPPFSGAIYFYNGDTTNLSEDHIEQIGGTLGYRTRGTTSRWCIPWTLDCDVDINSSVFDSNFLSFEYRHFLDQIGAVPGMAASAKTSFGPTSLVLEWNGAISNATFMDDVGTPIDITPQAWQIQLGYQFDWNPFVEVIGNQGTFVAVGYSESSDLAGVQRVIAALPPERVGFVPEKRLLASVGEWVLDGVRVEFEYAHDIDYSMADGGTGNTADGVFMQVTMEW